MKTKLLGLTVAGIACAASLTAQANTVTTTFGAYPSATFGGSGIYNDATMINTTTFGANTQNPDTITMVLTATPRGVGPELANNGVDTFYADPGAGSAPNRSKWNIDYDINSSLGSLIGYTLTLNFGKEGDPMHSLNMVIAFPDSTGAPGSWQNSENLGFGQFGAMGFDPTATGIYDFNVVVSKGDFSAQSATMHVNVGAVPDGGNTLFMLGSSIACCGFMVFRKNTKKRTVSPAGLVPA